MSQRVALVLGSGGARGYAHIGVIEWLVANGYSIRSIADSSIGALVGGIYATSRLDLYTNWVTVLEKRHVIRLLDIAFVRYNAGHAGACSLRAPRCSKGVPVAAYSCALQPTPRPAMPPHATTAAGDVAARPRPLAAMPDLHGDLLHP